MGAQRRRCPRSVGAAVAVAAVGMTLTACSPSPPPAPSPSPPITIPELSPTTTESNSSTPSPDPSPSPTSTLTEEQTAAAETVLEYFRLLNDLSKDPTMPVQPLEDITTGQTQSLDRAMITKDRENGIVQTGENRYFVTDIDKVLDRDNVRVAHIEACTDSTGTDLVDRSGTSVLGSDRAYFVEWDIEVINEGDGWKIGDITSGRVQKCGP